MGKSYIADDIMREYTRKKRYKENKERQEYEKFKREKCKDCQNKNTNICKIVRSIDGGLQCVFKK